MEECDLLEFPAGQCCNSRKKLQAIAGNLLDALPLLLMSQAKVLADDDEHPQLHKHERMFGRRGGLLWAGSGASCM